MPFFEIKIRRTLEYTVYVKGKNKESVESKLDNLFAKLDKVESDEDEIESHDIDEVYSTDDCPLDPDEIVSISTFIEQLDAQD